jgi:hypothetical protein
VTIVRTTSRISPPVLSNVTAARPTSAAGGSSATSRRASFQAMKWAVVGLLASRASISRPSASPAAFTVRPSTTLPPGSCSRASNAKTGAFCRRPRIVQPVKARATSVTSFCV